MIGTRLEASFSKANVFWEAGNDRALLGIDFLDNSFEVRGLAQPHRMRDALMEAQRGRPASLPAYHVGLQQAKHDLCEPHLAANNAAHRLYNGPIFDRSGGHRWQQRRVLHV